MKYLDYQGLQEYDALIKQYIQDNIPESSEIAEALQNAANPNSTIKIAICTQAEYNALQNPEQNVLYIISDETSEVVNVEANPTLDGTESVLGSIKIGGIKYKMPSIVANPTLDGTETALGSIGINGVNYAMPSGGGSSGGSIVEANPTLSGNETTLTGLGINGTNYAMPSMPHLYEHSVTASLISGDNTSYDNNSEVTFKVYDTNSGVWNNTTLGQYIQRLSSNYAMLVATGRYLQQPVLGIWCSSSSNNRKVGVSYWNGTGMSSVGGIYINYYREVVTQIF